MEMFEQWALETVPLKPSFFRNQANGTFLIWPHGRSTLDEVLVFFIQLHPHI